MNIKQQQKELGLFFVSQTNTDWNTGNSDYRSVTLALLLKFCE